MAVLNHLATDLADFMCDACLKGVETSYKVQKAEISYDNFANELPTDIMERKNPKSYMAGVSWDSDINKWTDFATIHFTEEDLEICYQDQAAYSAQKGKPQRGGHLDKLKYTEILRQYMNKHQKVCIYLVENQHHSKNSIIIYGYCRHYRHEKPCRLFKYVASLPQKNGMTFEVVVNQTPVNHIKKNDPTMQGIGYGQIEATNFTGPP